MLSKDTQLLLPDGHKALVELVLGVGRACGLESGGRKLASD